MLQMLPSTNDTLINYNQMCPTDPGTALCDVVRTEAHLVATLSLLESDTKLRVWGLLELHY